MKIYQKQPINKVIKGRHNSPSTEFKKGHKHSKETLLKISQSLKGRKVWNTGLSVRLNPKGEFKKGQTSPNKGKKFPLRSNKKHFAWKGEQVSYAGLHMWIKRHKVKPDRCSKCGKIGNSYQIQWSNIDHKYRRNLDDYIALCVPCHKKYDLKNGLTKH